LLAAALYEGETVIRNASPNYMVQDLCFFLVRLGVRIEGIGTTTLRVHGKSDIRTDVDYAPSEDPIEAMSLITAAIVTRSQITVRRVPIEFMEIELATLEEMGFTYERSAEYIAGTGQTLLHDWVYENRAIHLVELTKLGGKVKLMDPHRVLIDGPTRWSGTEIVCPPALRPAVVILLAMLAAKGTSVLRNVYVINRG